MDDFFTSTIDSFEQTINTNFISIFKCLKMILPFLSFNCSIVVIASQNGVVGHENRICYGPSKAVLIHLVKNISIDFSNCGYKDIKINSGSPGYIISDKNKNFFETNKGRKLINKSPYEKVVTIENIADCIEFLLSDKSIAIRGQNIIVDYRYTLI